MVTSSDIRKHMTVVASDQTEVGTIDSVTADHIKLTRSASPDGKHHLVPLSWVTRVDHLVHLNRPAADVMAFGAAGLEAGTASEAGDHVLPPIANPAIGDGVKRSNYYLPWILLGLAILVILLLLTRSCSHDTTSTTTTAGTEPAAQTGALPVEGVTLPGGQKINVAPGTLNYELQRYLASDEPTPRAFTFDKLNFDTAKSDIRAEDQATIDTLAQILNAYPNARAQVVGYADTTGTSQGNANLGESRAQSVLAALTAKGVAKDRLNVGSGGDSNPVATNATAGGRFANRRTELVITAK